MKPAGDYPSARLVRDVRFVREQDGEPELLLKDAVREHLEKRIDIARAYLVQTITEGEASAALCFVGTGGEDRGLVAEIGATFAGIFGGHEHLDIVSVNVGQEAQVESVSRPFYQR